jgi:hypothetical protein
MILPFKIQATNITKFTKTKGCIVISIFPRVKM